MLEHVKALVAQTEKLISGTKRTLKHLNSEDIKTKRSCKANTTLNDRTCH